MNCDNCGREDVAPHSADTKYFPKNRLGIKSGVLSVCKLCKDLYELREESIKKILDSHRPKKLIVAGPGTGKTFVFRRVIENLSSGSTAMVFTLINNLAEDLKGLESIKDRDVRASMFHGFCKNLLHSVVPTPRGMQYYGSLPILISKDAQVLGMNFAIGFDQAFAELRENVPSLKLYLQRASYYNAVSHQDAVYRVFKHFQENPKEIPKFSIVIADEYQDFNKLEASFIDLLATKSDLLIAGDDDQALYRFRFSSEKFIRDIFRDNRFKKFNLPLCSRCPPVLVSATNDFVKEVIAKGFLANRLPKPFDCYWPDKYKEDLEFPKIFHVKCSAEKTSFKYIEERIKNLTNSNREEATGQDLPFLIIGPNSSYHLRNLKAHLGKTLGDEFCIDYQKKDNWPQIGDGYNIIKKYEESNLGWRIILLNDPNAGLESKVIKQSFGKRVGLKKCLPSDYIKKHLARAEKYIPQSEADSASKDKIKVRMTTFLGSKGLSALHVFVIGLNNGHFPKYRNDLKDSEICEFIVALTRGWKSCHLISNKFFDHRANSSVERISEFVNMVPPDHKLQTSCTIKNGRVILL